MKRVNDVEDEDEYDIEYDEEDEINDYVERLRPTKIKIRRGSEEEAEEDLDEEVETDEVDEEVEEAFEELPAAVLDASDEIDDEEPEAEPEEEAVSIAQKPHFAIKTPKKKEKPVSERGAGDEPA